MTQAIIKSLKLMENYFGFKTNWNNLFRSWTEALKLP